jgi:serine/threonine protein kinase
MDISSGVEYIHSKNMLYLDIKAENILLSEGCRAKICDFGFSIQNAVEPVLWDGGTPTYTPPEFLRTGKRGRPADIWDCGLVMMFVLGIWPLPPPGKWTIANIRMEKGDAAIKMLEWFGEVERSKETIPDKYFLLLKMLAINPNHRITSSELVKNLRGPPQVEALIGELLV